MCSSMSFNADYSYTSPEACSYYYVGHLIMCSICFNVDHLGGRSGDCESEWSDNSQ